VRPYLQEGRFLRTFKSIWYGFLQIYAQLLLILFFHIRVYGRQNIPEKGAVIILSNHQSFLDPILIGVGLGRRVNFMARDTLFRNPFFGFLIRSLNAFPVKRGKVDLKALKHAIKLLSQGELLLLFPEGTRTSDGEIGKVRAGVCSIIKRADAVLIPAVIDGAYEAWPRRKKIFGFHKIRVIFGAPVEYGRSGRDDDARFSEMIQTVLRALQRQLRGK